MSNVLLFLLSLYAAQPLRVLDVSARVQTVKVWSDSTSVAVVTVECRSASFAPWMPLLQVANPNKKGKRYSIPRCAEVRARVSAYVTGTLHAEFR